MKLFNVKKLNSKMKKLELFFGILGAIFLLLLALHFHNHIHDLHVFSVNWAFFDVFYLLICILLTFSIFQDKKF